MKLTHQSPLKNTMGDPHHAQSTSGDSVVFPRGRCKKCGDESYKPSRRALCLRCFQKHRRSGMREWVKQLFAEVKSKPCTDCGRTYPACVMDFDHVRGEKRFALGDAPAKTRNNILEEIKKCDLVCANCHRIRTEERRVKAS